MKGLISPVDQIRKLMKKNKRNWSAFVSEAIAKELGPNAISLEKRVARLEQIIYQREKSQ